MDEEFNNDGPLNRRTKSNLMSSLSRQKIAATIVSIGRRKKKPLPASLVDGRRKTFIDSSFNILDRRNTIFPIALSKHHLPS
jgi:hypothetical protein